MLIWQYVTWISKIFRQIFGKKISRSIQLSDFFSVDFRRTKIMRRIRLSAASAWSLQQTNSAAAPTHKCQSRTATIYSHAWKHIIVWHSDSSIIARWQLLWWHLLLHCVWWHCCSSSVGRSVQSAGPFLPQRCPVVPWSSSAHEISAAPRPPARTTYTTRQHILTHWARLVLGWVIRTPQSNNLTTHQHVAGLQTNLSQLVKPSLAEFATEYLCTENPP